MSDAESPRLRRLLAGLRHAFAIEGPLGPLTEEDRKLLVRLATAVVIRRMAGPAILFLESARPLNYIGSQALVFLRPFLEPFFNPGDTRRLTEILERREGLRALVQAIEAKAAAKGKGEGG